MAAGDSSDILMKFVLKKKGEREGPIEGESSTELVIAGEQRSNLLAGFKKKFMFEIDSFNFSVGINDDSGAAPARPGQNPAAHGAAPRGTPAAPQGGFQAWRSGRPHKDYPVTVQPITFSRPIDRASNLLLQHCIACTSFESASLVKRKAAGTAAAGEGYLRMDFTGVLITEIEWSNDEPIKETCKFISRAITVRYRPQLPDGTLGIIRLGFWSMLPWEREAELR